MDVKEYDESKKIIEDKYDAAVERIIRMKPLSGIDKARLLRIIELLEGIKLNEIKLLNLFSCLDS
tara:strand:- start:2384 stop:2578 length:195 start_codon:yes stop_codon:yes gene_type:complete